jgi:hypothetical protein
MWKPVMGGKWELRIHRTDTVGWGGAVYIYKRGVRLRLQYQQVSSESHTNLVMKVLVSLKYKVTASVLSRGQNVICILSCKFFVMAIQASIC